jgi:hypothetical protein
MRVTEFNLAFPRLFRSWLPMVAIALLGASLAAAPAQAGPRDPGPLFGGPGEGEPYVDRLSPRVGWPPVPHRRPDFAASIRDDGDIDSWAIYDPPSPYARHKKWTYDERRYEGPPKRFDKQIFADSADRHYPGKVEPYYEEKPERPYPPKKHYRHDGPYADRSYVERETHDDRGEPDHAERPYRDRSYAGGYDEEDDRSYRYDDEDGRGRGYGRLFDIKPSRPKPSYAALKALGRSMIEEGEPGHPSGNSEMPAGYVYLGQLINHDITFDNRTDLGREIRGDDQLKNARTPELDLDNVYGRGPDESPALYRLPYVRVGQRVTDYGAPRYDLFRTRTSERYGPRGGDPVALIGDPRDDQNLIISQLHAAFVAFHNRTADILVEQEFGDERENFCGGNDDCRVEELAEALPRNLKIKIFEQARDHVIHFYHRVILEDYLPRTIGARHTGSLVKRGRDFFYPNGFRTEGPVRDIAIPVEFSAAAHRQGHSQVRDSYTFGEGRVISLFANREGDGPRIFEPVTERYLIDWRYFFEIGHQRPFGFNYARRIDPELVRSLHRLDFPGIIGMRDVTSLAARDLARGKSLQLPSGQQVARIILPQLAERGLLGKGNWNGEHGGGDYWRAFFLQPDERTRYFLGEAETPLAYYVLQEASVLGTRTHLRAAPYNEGEDHYSGDEEYRRGRLYHPASIKGRYGNGNGEGDDDDDDRGFDAGHRLGPVGATIVGEVLTGLIQHYRETTGKGIEYRPIVRGSESLLFGPDGKKARHRYLMRNLLIDAGVVDTN